MCQSVLIHVFLLFPQRPQSWEFVWGKTCLPQCRRMAWVLLVDAEVPPLGYLGGESRESPEYSGWDGSGAVGWVSTIGIQILELLVWLQVDLKSQPAFVCSVELHVKVGKHCCRLC